MTVSDGSSAKSPHLIRSLITLILGTLLLRTAAGAMGENIQFYLNYISDAAKASNHPLRLIAGAANVYEIPYTLRGLIFATFFITELICSPIFGAWSDRYGRKLFIIFGPLFGAVAVQITALTTILWALFLTRLLEGLSTASNAPSSLGYIAEATSDSPKLRTRIVGFYEVATLGGIAGGFSLGGWLWRHFGGAGIVFGIPLTSPAFAINALVYVASLVLLWAGLHEVEESRRSTRTVSPREAWVHYWNILSSPRVAGFAPAWVAINAVLGVWINLTAGLMTDQGAFPGQLLVGNLNSFQAGNVRAAFAVLLIVGIAIWSVFFSQMKRTTVMLIGVVGLFLTCIFAFLINHQPAFNAPLVLPLVGLLVISVLVLSGFTPAAIGHMADITEGYRGDRGAIMGLYSVFLGLGQVIGSTIGGPFVDWHGWDGVILVTALLGIIAGVITVRLHYSEDRLNASALPRADEATSLPQ